MQSISFLAIFASLSYTCLEQDVLLDSQSRATARILKHSVLGRGACEIKTTINDLRPSHVATPAQWPPMDSSRRQNSLYSLGSEARMTNPSHQLFHASDFTLTLV